MCDEKIDFNVARKTADLKGRYRLWTMPPCGDLFSGTERFGPRGPFGIDPSQDRLGPEARAELKKIRKHWDRGLDKTSEPTIADEIHSWQQATKIMKEPTPKRLGLRSRFFTAAATALAIAASKLAGASMLFGGWSRAGIPGNCPACGTQLSPLKPGVYRCYKCQEDGP